LFGSFGLSGLFGFLVERNQPAGPNPPDQQSKQDSLDRPDQQDGLGLRRREPLFE
jgi:hypothetical protein